MPITNYYDENQYLDEPFDLIENNPILQQEEDPFIYYASRSKSGGKKSNSTNKQRSNSGNINHAPYRGQQLTSDLIYKISKPYFGCGYYINTPEGKKRWQQAGKTVPSGLGKKLGEPIDCSGWTREFYRQFFGIDIGEGTKAQRTSNKFYKFTDKSQLRPGDLIHFKPNKNGIGHVGIAYKQLPNGKWLMIDSSTRPSEQGEGVGIRAVDYGREIVGYSRPIQLAMAKFGGRLIPKKRYIK